MLKSPPKKWRKAWQGCVHIDAMFNIAFEKHVAKRGRCVCAEVKGSISCPTRADVDGNRLFCTLEQCVTSSSTNMTRNSGTSSVHGCDVWHRLWHSLTWNAIGVFASSMEYFNVISSKRDTYRSSLVGPVVRCLTWSPTKAGGKRYKCTCSSTQCLTSSSTKADVKPNGCVRTLK